jgi:hypothetical protein
MSGSSLRLMAVAYYWHRKSRQLQELLDCASSVLRSEVLELRKQVDAEHQEISSISQGDNRHRMSTIREEDTDDDESDNLMGVFNRVIGSLKGTAKKAAETFVIYKE